jgi:hypothetical protein
MHTVICPSGLTFDLKRVWKLGDRKILMNPRTLKNGKALHHMLTAVAGEVQDAGPYEFQTDRDGNLKIDWEKVANSDIVTAIIEVRQLTRAKFAFDVLCEFCNERLPLEIDLRQIERKTMTDEGKANLQTGAPIEREVYQELDEEDEPVGEPIKLKLKLLKGSDHTRLMQFQKEEDNAGMLEVQNCMHIVELQAPGEQPLTADKHFRRIRSYYQNADWAFDEALTQILEETEGGARTSVEIFCRRCNADQEHPLPFNQDFFFPKKRKRGSFLIAKSAT